MAIEVFEKSKQRSRHAREVWPSESLEKGKLGPDILENLNQQVR